MIFSLVQKRRDVQQATFKLRRTKAIEQHKSAIAKANCKRLILSAKGIAAIFVAGGVKGALSDKNMSVSQLSTLVGKHFLAGWLSQADTSNTNIEPDATQHVDA